MSDKQTYCPSCLTTYNVTVAQLTIAQGMVCCPKCDSSFNALTHLLTAEKEISSSVTITSTHNTLPLNSISSHADHDANFTSPAFRYSILKIFEQKVENSNIDLKTYLNNLNYFSTEPIPSLTTAHWSEQEHAGKRSVLYYATWSILNLILIGALAVQFFWFNPHYLQSSPIMSKTLNSLCEIFSCSNLQEHYNLMSVTKIKIKSLEKNQTQFNGEIVNFHDRSLALPTLRIHLKANGHNIATYDFAAKKYLVKNLNGIERIPQNSPFQFEFILPIDRKNFNNYNFEIIRP